MSGKLLDRLVAAGVFVYALVLYFLTMAETSPFWDSGEFIAISHGLEVSHPPGAPFYMVVGRFFSLFAPLFSGLTPEPVAFAVNLVSVLCSAATVLLTHLVIVRLVRIWQGSPDEWTGGQRLAALGGGVIGSLAFAATDSFWFNAVEAEVYAMSMLFTAAVVWLALVWREQTREEETSIRARGGHPFGLHADRLLVAIAYLFGLALGIHLLNVLALFFVALLVYFEKVERPEWSVGMNTLMMMATGFVAAVFFVAIYPGVVQWLPEMGSVIGSPMLMLVLVVAVLTAAVWWTHANHRPIANLIALSFTVIVIGYSSYAVIFIRSAADPPIDENDPETAEAIVSYLKREQFGDTPLLKGLTYEPSTQMVGWEGDLMTGQVRRADEVFFPRRHSFEPSHGEVYREYSSDLDYFFRYQLGHMYWRYFLWQFAGKAGDYQDAGWISGFGGKGDLSSLSPSEAASRNAYYMLPLLLGLIGLAFHYQKDWRRALAVTILFIISGVGIIVYLNQTPLQPRERDYSYVGSFFAFALWIGVGATGLLTLTAEALARQSAAIKRFAPAVVAALLFVAIPGWMTVENYDDHDRSGRTVATDFARNMLESTAPNAILFTNGDNDTFPLWYLQEVMGVRRDVRVVNLSLLNTPWYIKQLKNQWSRDSAPIPFTLTDEQIERLQPLTSFTPGEYRLPVNRERLLDETLAGRVDTSAIPSQMTWTLNGRSLGEGQSALYIADLAVLDILRANAEAGWERPVYFATTVGPDSELDLQSFMQNEGLARRIVPVQRQGVGPDGYVVADIAKDRLSKYRFNGLNDPSIYLDENARNMADAYRRTVGGLAAGLAERGDTEAARQALARLDTDVPTSNVPASFPSLYTLAEAYSALGDTEGLVRTLRGAEDQAIARLLAAKAGRDQETAMQYVQLVSIAYVQGGAYDAAAAFSNRLAEATGVEDFRQSADEIREQARQLNEPDSARG